MTDFKILYATNPRRIILSNPPVFIWKIFLLCGRLKYKLKILKKGFLSL